MSDAATKKTADSHIVRPPESLSNELSSYFGQRYLGPGLFSIQAKSEAFTGKVDGRSDSNGVRHLPENALISQGRKNTETILIHRTKYGRPCQIKTYEQKKEDFKPGLTIFEDKEEFTVPAGNIKDFLGNINDFSARVDRYQAAKKRAQIMTDFLCSGQADSWEERTPAERGLNIENCGSYLEFRNYFTHPDNPILLSAANFCKQHLLCPLCAIRRSTKMLSAYMPKVQNLINLGYSPYMVTLTVKNGDDLLERFNHLRSSVQLLMYRGQQYHKRGQNSDTQAKYQFAAVGSYEIKIGQNSGEWHPHIHMIWMCKRDRKPDKYLLSQEWEEITQDSKIIDIRPIKIGRDLVTDNLSEQSIEDLASGLVEVFKYPMKFGNMTPEQNWHCFKTLKGKNLIASWGKFRTVKIPKSLLDKPLEDKDLPYLLFIYRYYENQYNLKKIKISKK